MAGITATGFEAKTLDEIIAEIEADLRAKVAPGISTSADSVLGQVIRVVARQIASVWELGAAVYSSQYPDGANGFSLDSVASMTGTARKAATKSTALCTVNVDPGTYAIGTLVAHVAGDPTKRFVNIAAAVNGGGAPANVTGVLFQAEDTGPIRANASTLTVIANPVAGWHTVTNPADAGVSPTALGTELEGDTALRVRREAELAGAGESTVDAIRADLLKVDGVTAVQVLENDTDASVVIDSGTLVAHSVEAIVLGGTDADVAKALWETKGGGPSTNGSTSVVIQDSQNRNHTVKFTRPTPVTIHIEVTLTAEADTYGGDSAVKTAITDFAATMKVGDDVIPSRLVAEIFAKVAGIITIPTLKVDDVDPPITTGDFPITARQLASILTANIDVVATLV